MRQEVVYGAKRWGLLIALLLVILLLLSLDGRLLAYLALYNADVLAIVKESEGVAQTSITQTPQFMERSPAYQELFPCAAGSLKTWLALQANQWASAAAAFDGSACVQSRFTYPDISLKMSSSLLIGANNGWVNQRKIAIDTMFLNALHQQHAGETDEALKWFRKGLVLAPGRIPAHVRQKYYTALAEWFAGRREDEQAQELLAKATCLIDSDEDCLGSLRPYPFETWPLPVESVFTTKDGWRLVGLEIDRDALGFGIEVLGRLHWQRETSGHLERIAQDFLVPNLAPNAGFEIDALIDEECVSGYESSHMYVLPCMSHALPDPYALHPGLVAITETQAKGVALASATFPVTPDSSYLVGSRLCADGGAEAFVGRDLISVSSGGVADVGSVEWFFSQKTSTSDQLCWQQHVAFVVLPADAEEFRLRLQREALTAEGVGRAMFDDIFFFAIPTAEIGITGELLPTGESHG